MCVRERDWILVLAWHGVEFGCVVPVWLGVCVCVCWHDVCVNQGAWLRQTGLAGWRGTPHHRSLAWRDRGEPWIHIHTHRFSGRAPSGTGSFLTDTHTVSIHLSSAGHSQGGVCTTLTRMKDTCYCCVNDSITHRINIRINIKSTWLKYCTKSIITFPSVLPKLLCPTLKMESAVGGNSRHNTVVMVFVANWVASHSMLQKIPAHIMLYCTCNYVRGGKTVSIVWSNFFVVVIPKQTWQLQH